MTHFYDISFITFRPSLNISDGINLNNIFFYNSRIIHSNLLILREEYFIMHKFSAHISDKIEKKQARKRFKHAV